MNNIEPAVYNSVAYYSNITSVEFIPVEIVKRKPDIKKGEPIKKKLTFFRKKAVEYAKSDIYKYEGCFLTAEQYAKMLYISYNKENDSFFRMATVRIHFDKGSELHRFDSNDDAISFIQELKTKCEECGNKLL